MKLKETTINSKKIYEGKILTLYLDEVKLPSGNTSFREYSKHPFAAACILKYKTKFVLVEQFRYPLKKCIIESPAGKSNLKETPLQAVKREVLEETGFTIKNIKSLGYFYPAAAYTDEKLYIYYAEVDKKKSQNFDEDEALNLKFYSKSEIIKMIKEDKITDAKTLIGFLKYFCDYAK